MHQPNHTQLFHADQLRMPPLQQEARAVPRTHRASNDDRRDVTEQLQAHYVAGRLSSSELESRVEQAVAAVTLGDLDVVLADLPTLAPVGASIAEPTEKRRGRRHLARGPHGEKSFRANATSYLLVMALLVAIWAITSPGGYFWPIWPMLGWGIGVAAHGLAERREQSSLAGYR